MSDDESRPHSKQVDKWINQNAGGLPSEKLVVIFGEAIQAIHRRAGTTLSEITLSAIFDRVLLTSQQKFNLLAKAEIKSKGISLDALMGHASDFEPDEVTDAFRFFLIELLTILANLTADILTKPLYQELFSVTAESVHMGSKASRRGLRSVKVSSDRDDA